MKNLADSYFSSSFLSQWDKFHFYFSSSVKHEEPAERSVGSE